MSIRDSSASVKKAYNSIQGRKQLDISTKDKLIVQHLVKETLAETMVLNQNMAASIHTYGHEKLITPRETPIYSSFST